jgi:uncharacterized protein with PhoU and TrkA domain
MTSSVDYLAKRVRELILEIDTLGYVFNEITETYLDGYAENEDINHPIRKLSVSLNVITNANKELAKLLLEDVVLDENFRKSLKKIALMDRLRDGERESEFVRFVDTYIKD